MSSKAYYRSRIASERKKIVSLRQDIKDIKENKKRKAEYLSRSIKNTNDKGTKERYRKQKIDLTADTNNKVDRLKARIESIQKGIESLKRSLERAK